MQFTPISKDSALRRIHAAGLTLNEAINMNDNDLLRLPSIGRRTLIFIRTFKIIQT